MRDYAFDILDATTAPVITHDASWMDTIPAKMKDLITPARMAALKNNEELATYPECACFLTTRSAVAPMDADWTEIFCYVTCKSFDMLGENYWDTLGVRKELSRNQQDKLTGLRNHIYNSRRKILKQRLWKQKN